MQSKPKHATSMQSKLSYNLLHSGDQLQLSASAVPALASVCTMVTLCPCVFIKSQKYLNTSSVPLTDECFVTDDNIHNWRWQVRKTYCFSTCRIGKSFKQFPFTASQSQSLVFIWLQEFHMYLRSYLPQSQKLNSLPHIKIRRFLHEGTPFSEE